MKDRPLFSRSLFRIGWRYLRAHLWQSMLMVLGISIGVAVSVGIDIANLSASRAFDLSTETIAGRATHYISGGSQGVDDALYVSLRRAGLDIPTAPVITDYVTSPYMDNTTLQLLGVDPFSEAPFRNYLGGDDGVPLDGLTTFLTQPGSVLLSESKAAVYDLSPGDNFDIEYAGRTIPVSVAGLLKPADNLTRQAIDSMLLVDIATAQEITGRFGQVDRVDLIVPNDESDSLDQIQAMLPGGVLVLPNEVRVGAIEEITAAFRLNLTALSLLALVVALFLIYNTMTFSVVQRRPLFGTLRSLGVTRREVFLMVVSEAVVIGFIGAIFGVSIGILMGRGAVSLVSQTINDLFFVTTVRDIPIPLISLVKGFALGVLATVITAAFPAWEAASVTPRTALSRANLESKAQRIVHWLGIAGLLIIVIGSVILWLSDTSLVLSFGGTFAVIFGFAILTPTVTIWLMSVANRFTSLVWGLLGRMAPREVVNSISRTSVAVAALMVAIAVTIGVSIMVGSFRFTVDTWMNQILHGDIYVSVPGATVSQPLQAIDPMAIEILREWEGVERVDLLQNALVDSPAGPIQISANNNPNDGLEQLYRSSEYAPEDIWQAIEQGAVLVSEPLANRLDLPLQGGELQLYTKDGLRSFPVAGIYYDYASSQGNAILALEKYREYWDDDQVAAAAILLEPGMDAAATADNIKLQLAEIQSLLVRPNQVLRDDALEVFDRTFAITSALQLMTTIVAFVGVLSAMMSLQLDKQRQLGILKAIGLTGRQMWRLITLETGLMGTVAGLLSMPTGYILALILVFIINQRSFGWTLQMQLSPEPFIQAFVIAVSAAVLAGLYPALRIMKRNTSEAIRFD